MHRMATRNKGAGADISEGVPRRPAADTQRGLLILDDPIRELSDEAEARMREEALHWWWANFDSVSLGRGGTSQTSAPPPRGESK